MKYFVIADTHFWHQLVINIWDREKWFEERIFKQLSILPSDAILIHLWDICIWNDQTWHNRIMEIPNKKILIMGNHDHKSYTRYLEHWRDLVCEEMVMRINNKYILFTHKPKLNHWYDINIHWHMHKKFNREMWLQNRRWCYSCEKEKYVPKTVDNIITNFNSLQKQYERTNPKLIQSDWWDEQLTCGDESRPPKEYYPSKKTKSMC